MLTLLIFAILSCSINSIWTATPYQDCGSESGTIQAFAVTNCTAAPCKFIKGNTYSMNLTFAAKSPSNTASVAIHGIIAGIPVPFPIPIPDACRLHVNCPINVNDVNVAQLALPVLSTYPSLSLYVEIEIKDSQNHDYACIKFPATITTLSESGHNRFDWKKGKLFEKLH